MARKLRDGSRPPQDAAIEPPPREAVEDAVRAALDALKPRSRGERRRKEASRKADAAPKPRKS